MRIGLDAMGGDQAPQVIIDGLKKFLIEKEGKHDFFLLGHPDKIKPLIPTFFKKHSIEIVPALEVIEMHELPVKALRSKKDSSMVRLIEMLKNNQIDVALSAGNTGALVASSLLRLRCLPGIDRPAFATILPSLEGTTVLLDSGANVDCSTQLLVQFALMGVIYAKDLLNISSPRVALLNMVQGTNLGSKEVLEANKLLMKSQLNYCGLVQANEMFGDDIDVLITDGFTGNVALKAAQSTMTTYAEVFKDHLSKKFYRKLGAFLIKPAFQSLKKKMDYSEIGGAPLLGVSKNVIKSHGGSNAKAICNAISVAIQSIEKQLNLHITEGINKYLSTNS